MRRGPLGGDKVVNIPRAGVRDVADALRARRRHRSAVALHRHGAGAEVARRSARGRIPVYAKQASLQDVIDTIIEGKVVQHAITIPEGLTSEQIVQRLLETDVLAGNIRDIPREGSLLPETYRVTRGTPREQVIQRMQQAQKRVVQETWERRAPAICRCDRRKNW